MYVSIRDVILRQTGFTKIAEGLSHYGLDAVELMVNRDFQVHALTPTEERPHLFLDRDEDVTLLREQSERSGARVCGFLLPTDFRAEDIEKELAWIVRVVRVAATLGVPVVRVDAIVHGAQELSREQLQELFARGVGRVLEETDGLPVDLGIENHGAVGNDPAFLEGLMAAVGSARLGMTLDSGNFYWAGHPLQRVYEILERLAPTAKRTHIKNIRYPEEIRETQRETGYGYREYVSPIPEGDIDHGRFVGFLKQVGYDRDLCIEDESLGKFDQEGRRAKIQAAVDHLRGLI